ncbi:MAG: ROK family protein [Clostridiales bacterium]|jgi:predicted NBD/HSP70 family sugar kinase|nr:ROK family protein [Clostridiales bacterium]
MNIIHTVDQTHIRSINQRVILEKIYCDEPISRAELSRELCISKSAMTENISSLLDIGIIQEVGAGAAMSTGGRKPILLKFNENYQYIIAIELNFEDPIFVLGNLRGETLNKITVAIANDAKYPERLNLVLNATNLLLSTAGLSRQDLAIIAISCPGVFDPENRNYYAESNFANWNMSDLSRQLEELFETQVLVVNDVNAAAVGEFTTGAGKKAENLVYISGGYGFGAGIIINGKLYLGSTNRAGEISNSIPAGPLGLVNGKFGNLGDAVNIRALKQYIRAKAPKETRDAFAALGKSPDSAGFKDIVRVWREGDEFLKKCIEETATIIGATISNIISLLNCDMVILGGDYVAFQSQMLPIINRIVQESAFEPVSVVSASLETNAGICGLFALSKEIIFDKICNYEHT